MLLQERREHLTCIDEMAKERQQQVRVFDSLTAKLSTDAGYAAPTRSYAAKVSGGTPGTCLAIEPGTLPLSFPLDASVMHAHLPTT